MNVAVKICGVRTVDDARFAIEQGAQLIGLNFYAKSPRFVSTEDARAITDALRGRAEFVGVFVNEPTPQVLLGKARAAGVDTAQLHGDEDAAFVKAVCAEMPTIRAIKVDAAFDAARAAAIDVDRLLLDAATPMYGGSGLTVDWRVAAALIALRPETILAGGLGPDNIAEALRRSGARVLDVCSGVELAPGKKDQDKIKRLMAAVAASAEERL